VRYAGSYTIVRIGDAFEWNPYSEELHRDSLSPNFYDVILEEPLPGFVSQNVAVLARVLEQVVEEIS